MPDTSFRSYPTADGMAYEIDNLPVSKEEFDARRVAAKQELSDFRTAPTEGMEDLESLAAGARERLRKKVPLKKYGGEIKSKISTHKKSKKSPSW